MLVAVVVLCVAGALIVGAFARLWVLRGQWKNQPPPTYSRPYRRWKDDEDDR